MAAGLLSMYLFNVNFHIAVLPISVNDKSHKLDTISMSILKVHCALKCRCWLNMVWSNSRQSYVREWSKGGQIVDNLRKRIRVVNVDEEKSKGGQG